MARVNNIRAPGVMSTKALNTSHLIAYILLEMFGKRLAIPTLHSWRLDAESDMIYSAWTLVLSDYIYNKALKCGLWKSKSMSMGLWV